MTLSDGTLLYEGDWKNDGPNGYGTLYEPNGDIYEGELR